MRIVALLFRRVGDSLLATPALRAVKRKYPAAKLTVVAEPHVARVFEGNPWLDEIRTVSHAPSVPRLAAAIRHEGTPEVALDFLSDPRSALACLLSGAHRRIGFAYHYRSWIYHKAVPLQDPQHPVYSAQHKLGLAAALGAPADDLHTELHLTSDDHEFAAAAWTERQWPAALPVMAFFVHSRREHKRWPTDAFCALIRRVQDERLATPLILVTPGDQSAASEIRARANLHNANLIPIQRLGRLGAVLERCRLLVGNDGGPKHVAVALNVPTVTIFSADSAEYWTPPDSPHHVAVTAEAEAVREITTDRVYEAARTLLTSMA